MIFKSFTEKVLPEVETPIEAYDKITMNESVSLISFENEKEITILENYISSKNESHFALNYLVKVIGMFPNNKRVLSILSEIPNRFIVISNDNIEFNTYDNLIKICLFNIQTTLITLIEDIANSGKYTNKHLNEFVHYLNSAKICIMLKSSVNDKDHLSIQEQNAISNTLIISICEMFNNFGNKVFQLNKYEHYLANYKVNV